MPTEQKENAVEEMTALLKDSKAVYFADFTGLDVPAFTALRQQLHAEDVTFTVVKNRLAKIAAANAGIEGLDGAFSGPTGMVCAKEDPIAPARLMSKFAETTDGKPKMKLLQKSQQFSLAAPMAVYVLFLCEPMTPALSEPWHREMV